MLADAYRSSPTASYRDELPTDDLFKFATKTFAAIVPVEHWNVLDPCRQSHEEATVSLRSACPTFRKRRKGQHPKMLEPR